MIYFLCKQHYPDIVRVCSETGWHVLSKKGFDYFLDGTKKNIHFGNDIAIRWGAYFTVPIPTVNSKEAASLAAHKSRSRKILSEHVPTPKTWYSLKDAEFPCIGRPSRHSGGEDFVIVEKNVSLPNGWYFSEIIDSKEEYRVYVGYGKILGAYKKKFKEGEIRANRAITGLQWGSLVSAPTEVEKVALTALKCINLDFGAVDILGGKVIEVNTCPTISNKYTRDMLINFIKNL